MKPNITSTKNRPNPESKARVVFPDCGGLIDALDTRPTDHISDWTIYTATSKNDVIKRAQGADIFVTNKIEVDEQVLLACPTIKHIAVSATGFNVIDIAACKKHGVSVSNIPSYADVSVPEHVITVALALRRELLQYRQQVINNQWQNSVNFCLFDKPISDLKDSVFGVLGFGQLGRATAELAKALGMTVIYNSRTERPNEFADYVSFEQLIEESDILSLHCNLTPETKNLIAKAELSAMKGTAILINTARGGIADEVAVVDAIENNTIAGIGFDVLTQEPPTNNSPLLKIANRTNVIITPHVAWASDVAIASLCAELVSNVHAFIKGQARNLVF